MSKPEVGIVFPFRDIADNREDLLSFAPEAEGLGLDFIVSYDHIVGVNPANQNRKAGVNVEFSQEHMAHEPMVLLGVMGALTKHIRLVSGVMVAPQRPTPLIAKQAAEVDILSGGRLTLGLGLGWNELEFEAMGANFGNRARRLEEQIPLLRKFWTNTDIEDRTSEEVFSGIDIRPLPVQQPIPIWLGGLANKAIERAARISEGWIPLGYISDEMESKINYFQESCSKADKASQPIMGRINPWRDSIDDCLRQFERWHRNGATHIAVGTSLGCFTNSEQYFGEMQNFLNDLERNF